jgi:hypothetical protein
MMATAHARTIVWLFAAATLVGCRTREYEIAQVEGTLLIDGRPGDMIRVEFAPDGAPGPTSSAETDGDGKFSLSFFERDASSPESGAVVGKHRVTLSDLRRAASATGGDVPRRFGQEYGLVSTTPLSVEVKPAAQTIDLTIP